MTVVPAFCNSCGAVFPSSFKFSRGMRISLKGCESGPCPRCGGMGHLPDGVFNFIDDSIEILSAPARTLEELRRLTRILREAQERMDSAEAVATLIRTETPELARVADLLPKNRAELYGFLSLLIATVMLILQLSQSQPKQSAININANQVVNQVYIESQQPAASTKAPKVSPKKPRRNDPCPCGSGKKYKRCCGAVK